MSISTADIEIWNEFTKGLNKVKKVSSLKISDHGKKILDKVKANMKEKEPLFFYDSIQDDKTLSNNFVLKKENSLGIDNSSDKKLRQGKFKIDYKLDLHGFTINEAYDKTKNLFELACYNNYKCLLIITGKALNSQNKTIKQSLEEWFEESFFSNKIIKYTKASLKHGGSGAVYVLLKNNF